MFYVKYFSVPTNKQITQMSVCCTESISFRVAILLTCISVVVVVDFLLYLIIIENYIQFSSIKFSLSFAHILFLILMLMLMLLTVVAIRNEH